MKKSEAIISQIKNTGASEWILLAALLISGGFYEPVSCLLSVVLSAVLIARIIMKKKTAVYLNLTSAAVAVCGSFFLISPLYAADRGLAFIGFLKFLPVVLFMILIMSEKDPVEKILSRLSPAVLIIGIISAALMPVPALDDYFSVAGRLAGFFQYPNTFALLLLVAELLWLCRPSIKPVDIICIVLLCGLIFLTGSRTVFVLAVPANIILLMMRPGRKIKIITPVVFVALAAAVLLLYPAMKGTYLFARLSSISFSESTFVGRLLYWQDAWKIISTHPFGIGYGSYYYMQQSIQTGVYSTRYVHNELLQLALDIGWLPCLVFAAAVIRVFFSKKTPASRKVILAVIILHSLFDFDMQFTSMLFLLLLFLEPQSGKKTEAGDTPICTSSALCGALSLYFTIALAMSLFGADTAAVSMYAGNTASKIHLLTDCEDTDEQVRIADEIIAQSKYVSVAYSAKAAAAFSEGEIEDMIEYENQAISIAPFAYSEYERYCYMLIQCIYMYEQAGDTDSSEYCQEELRQTVKAVQHLNDRLSDYGRKIADQPQTKLPEEITEIYNQIK